jgi:ABC-type lipoprotein release transport system permease subunit
MKSIQRHRYFLDFTLSSLLRRKWKNISLIVVYTLIVFLITSVLFFANAIRREAEAVLAGAPEMVIQKMMAGRHDLIPLNYADKIKGIRGVRDVKGRLWGYYYHQASGSNYTVMATDDFLLKGDEAVIGNGVLRTWGTVQENQLYFKSYEGNPLILKIKDVLSADTDLISSDLILTSATAFRRIFGVPEGFATDLTATIRNLNEASTISEKVVTVLPDTRPVLREEILRTYMSIFDWRSGYVLVLLSGAVLAFFIFAWDKATGLSGEERSEIGILKALGWDTSDILLLKFWEGLVICLTAFVVGVIAAYIHVFFAAAPLFEHALKGWAVLYPSFRLNPEINIYQLAVVFALTVLPYVLITIVPAWRVAITDPDAVMRQS